MKRWIDTAVTRFNIAMWGTTIGTFALLAFFVFMTEDLGFPYLNTAFVISWLIAVFMTIPILIYMKRRPTDKEPTWGEAMLGATYVFALLFWIYGVVPHQFLTFADNELSWRSDRRLIGPRLPAGWGIGEKSTVLNDNGVAIEQNQGILDWALPFHLNYRVVRDVLAVVLYNVYLAANIAVWSMWQRRDEVIKTTDVEKASRYGRPVVRRERPAEPVGV